MSFPSRPSAEASPGLPMSEPASRVAHASASIASTLAGIDEQVVGALVSPVELRQIQIIAIPAEVDCRSEINPPVRASAAATVAAAMATAAAAPARPSQTLQLSSLL